MAKEQFKELSKTDDEKGKDIVDFFMDIYDEKTSYDVNFEFQSNSSLKQLCKVTKIPDNYSVIIGSDVLVQIREDYFDAFEEETNKILIDEQINRIEYNMEKGSFKITKENFIGNKGIVSKYGYNEVKNAHELEVQLEEQLKEAKKEAKAKNKK